MRLAAVPTEKPPTRAASGNFDLVWTRLNFSNPQMDRLD
jgi:hypothetical protein